MATKEELEKQIADAQQALAELPDNTESEEDDASEDQEDQEEEDTQEDEEIEEKVEDSSEDQEEEDQEEQEEESEEEEEETSPDEDKEEEPAEDKTEKRLHDTQSRLQFVTRSKIEQEKLIDEAYEMAEPTEDQLKKEFSEWDDLSDFEKRMAKENLHNRLINGRIRQIRTDFREQEKQISSFVKRVDAYAVNPETLKKYPSLEGKQGLLSKFAARPERITLPLEDLVQLFLVKTVKPTIKHKGKMFETGSRGGADKTRPTSTGKISLSDANELMKKNYPEYKRLLKEKKIDFGSN